MQQDGTVIIFALSHLTEADFEARVTMIRGSYCRGTRGLTNGVPVVVQSRVLREYGMSNRPSQRYQTAHAKRITSHRLERLSLLLALDGLDWTTSTFVQGALIPCRPSPRPTLQLPSPRALSTAMF